MNVQPIDSPAPGEEILQVDPILRPHVEAAYRQRTRMFPRRTLSDSALRIEQEHRSAHLVRMGQARAPGVVAGLDVLPAPRAEGAIPFALHVQPGLGLTASGEETRLPYAIDCAMDDLPVYAPSALLGVDPDRPDLPLPGTDHRGRLGETLGALRDDPALPRAGVLVLRPVIVDYAGQESSPDPCAVDLTDLGYEDWREVDGVQLVYYALYAIDGLTVPAATGLSLAQWRNRLVHALFEYERTLPGEQRPPWSALGTPLALIGCTGDWSDCFVDRYAVVRQGGLPKPRQRLQGGGAILWQARMQQFAARVAEALRLGSTVEEVAQATRYMPPAGLLPREVVELALLDGTGTPDDPRGQQHLFPPNYVVEAAPIPVDQLDVALEASAGLASFDFTQPDHVRILVPVPPHYYDPDLLLEELPDPEFEAHLAVLIEVRADLLGRQQDLVLRANALADAIDGRTIAGDFGQQLEEDEAVNPLDYSVAEQQSRFGVTIAPDDGDPAAVASTVTVDGLTALREELAAWPQIGGRIISEFDTHLDAAANAGKGLLAFAAYIKGAIDEADSVLDMRFLRVQTEVFRLRKWVLGKEKATRLSTSPIGAEVLDATTEVELDKIQDVFLARIATLEQSGGPTAAPAADIAGEAAAAPLLFNVPEEVFIPPADVFGAVGPALIRGTNILNTRGLTTRDQLSLDLRSGATIGIIGGMTGGFTGGAIGGVVDTGVKVTPETPAVIQPESLGVIGTWDKLTKESLYSATGTFAEEFNREAILQGTALVGKTYEFRTTTIAQRMTTPPANETKTSSNVGYFEALTTVDQLAMYTDDIRVSNVPEVTTGDSGLQYVRESVANGQPVLKRRTDLTFGDLKGSAATTGGFQVFLGEPDPPDADEAQFFSESINVLDGMVATLRRVEQRVAAYRAVLSKIQEVVTQLRDHLTQADRALKASRDDVAQARHDVAVAQALAAEDARRRDQINRRRQAILANHVEFLAYQRPRLVSAVAADVPFRALDSALETPLVPACLHANVRPPDELRAMVDLLRDVPLVWFKQTDAILDSVERVDSLRDLIASAQNRYTQQRTAVQLTYAASTGLTNAMSGLFHTQYATINSVQQERAALMVARAIPQTWQAAKRDAQEIVSLADLLDSRWRGSKAAKVAAQELDDIADVATCLYARAGQVPVGVRLAWAERISQFDAPLNLSNLRVLPRWREVDGDLAGDMQTFVDWLFGRINPEQVGGLALMSDIVRMSLLVASHAPVNQIVAGYVRAETPAKVGNLVAVTTLSPQIRVGMPALVYQGNAVVAKAVVDDLAAGETAIRLTEVVGAVDTLTAQMKVQFGAQSTSLAFNGLL